MSRDDIHKVTSFSVEALDMIDRACAMYRRRLTEYAMFQAANTIGRKHTVQVDEQHVQWSLDATGGCRKPTFQDGKLT